MCLAQGYNTVTLLRLNSAAPLSGVKHSTTIPLCSLYIPVNTGLPGLNQYQAEDKVSCSRTQPSASCEMYSLEAQNRKTRGPKDSELLKGKLNKSKTQQWFEKIYSNLSVHKHTCEHYVKQFYHTVKPV